MNARDNTPLRTLIANRLSAGEDTAVGIANAIGKGDTPSIVVKELNAMRTDGQVECEQRGKKKELVYWLAVPLDVAAASVEPAPSLPPATIGDVMLPPGVRHGTRAAQIYRALPAFGAEPMTARQIATANGAALGLISPTISGMVKAGQISRVSSGVGEAYGYTRLPPAVSDSEGGDIDIQNAQPEVAKNTGSSASGSLSPSEGAAVQPEPAPVAADTPTAAPVAADDIDDATDKAEQDQRDAHYRLIGVLADIRAAVGDKTGKIMLGELAAHIGKLYELGEAHRKACMQWERAMMAAVGEDGVGSVVEVIDRLKENLRDAHLELAVIRELLAERIGGEIDPSDMSESEIARAAAAVIDAHDDELLAQAKTIIDLRNQLGEERTARQALQEQIDELQREAMRGASLLSGSDRYTAAGYLVRASKRKPRTLLDKDKARDAALSSIRAGAQRAEVFALVPIGHARRGVEWRPA